LVKRTFGEIRREILLALSSSNECSINFLSRTCGTNWRTVEKHLVYLVGRGYAKEIYSSSYVRILKATERGQAIATILEEGDIAI